MQNKILVTQSSMPPFEEYVEMIKPLWNSHWLTNMGIYHKQLEKKLMEYLGVEYLSLMVNGHMALELAIQSNSLSFSFIVISTSLQNCSVCFKLSIKQVFLTFFSHSLFCRSINSKSVT